MHILNSYNTVYTLFGRLYFECKFCNICWVLAATTRATGKAGHMSDMLTCNKFKEVIITVSSTDPHWAYFMRYGNATRTSVQLGIREHWERFPIKVFEGKHSFSLGF